VQILKRPTIPKFWALQAGGWLLYALVVFLPPMGSMHQFVLFKATSIGFGIALSSVLRIV
jgi:hypothetical protein